MTRKKQGTRQRSKHGGPGGSTQRVVKAATAEVLLQHVPQLAGLHPADSLVLVMFGGKRTIGAMRVDLLRSEDELDVRRWATTVTGMACRVDGITGLVPVAYTPETFAPSGRPPASRLLRAVAHAAERAGLEIKDLLCVAPDGWGSLRDPELPRGGRDLALIVPRGGDRPLRAEAVPEPPPASDAACARHLEQIERWWARADGPGGVLHGVDLRRRGSAFGRGAEDPPAVVRLLGEPDLISLVEAAMRPHEALQDERCGCRSLLGALAGMTGAAQAILVQIGWGRQCGEAVWAYLMQADPDAPVPPELDAALTGGAFRRPDVDRVDAGIAVLLEVAALTPEEGRGELDGMLAWLHWALGASSVAARLAVKALSAAPADAIAAAVLRAVDAGRLPEWAFRKDPATDPMRQLA